MIAHTRRGTAADGSRIRRTRVYTQQFREFKKELYNLRKDMPGLKKEDSPDFANMDFSVKAQILEAEAERKMLLREAKQDCASRIQENLSPIDQFKSKKIIETIIDRDVREIRVKQGYTETKNLLANQYNGNYKAEHTEFVEANTKTLELLEKKAAQLKVHADNSQVFAKVQETLANTDTNDIHGVVQQISDLLSNFS